MSIGLLGLKSWEGVCWRGEQRRGEGGVREEDEEEGFRGS